MGRGGEEEEEEVSTSCAVVADLYLWVFGGQESDCWVISVVNWFGCMVLGAWCGLVHLDFTC
ncbi:hypothetical protein BJX70DRAFT_374816 [Aspergillus crustosus]